MTDALLDQIMDETLTPDVRATLAAELVSLPGFDTAAAIKQLQIEWWGDNPIGCRLAFEALEAAIADD